MLEEGKSYSGNERNSAFLHLGGEEPRYADVSGACGLDVMDDGRSIGVCDWDYDGRQDFWITNRTAPRLRLQHNRSRNSNGFLAFKLRGKSCNRNAIGARVELRHKGGGKKQIRTLRAGEGFLAQSSSWIQFGLPPHAEIAEIIVRWPGGDAETITGWERNSFHLVEQGSGTARSWLPPRPSKGLHALPAGPQPTRSSEAARIVMASPLPFPAANYLDLEGTRKSLDNLKRPLLINLWATWCAPCVAEMNEWTRNENELRKLGVEVLALSVDDPEAGFADRIKVVAPFLKQRKFPYPSGLADAGFLDVLEVAGRAQIDKYESFPVPSTLLLDSRGRMALIYKGPVDTAQLARDISLLEAPKSTRHQAAVHFPGKWIEAPWPASPTAMIDKFMSFGQPEAARSYLDRFMTHVPGAPGQELAEAYFLVGSELAIQKNFREALTALGKSITLNPAKIRARLQLATILFRFQRYAESIPHLRVVVTAHPQDHNSRKMLSLALSQAGDYANAARHLRYLSSLDALDAMAKLWHGHALVRLGKGQEAERLLRDALKLQPDSLLVINELAWVLATHPDSTIRKPAEALQLADKAARLSKRQEPRVLDTLAAAQAAGGDFKAAIATITAALELTREAKNEATQKQLEERLALYRDGLPHVESFPNTK